MTPNAPTVESLFAELERARVGYDDALDDAEVHRARRDAAAGELAAAGVSYERIGAALGITRSRAWQLVMRARAR